MKRYEINITELAYLRDMIEYLANKENELSDEGHKQLNEVFDRIQSRRVMTLEIDPKVFDEVPNFNEEPLSNDTANNNTDNTVEEK